MRLTITALLFVALPLYLHAQDLSPHYHLYDVRQQKLCTLQDIAQDMDLADVIFFGEEHNDSAAHYLELELLKALHARHGSRAVLSLEMFETDCQLVLDEYLGGHITEERFTREARPWNNYRDYRPMIEFSKQLGLHVIAANPPRRYVNMVSRKGMKSLDSLPKASKKFLPPLPYDTLGGKYREKFMEFMRGGSPGTSNFRIYYSQNLWDAGMAYSIYRYWKKHKDKKILHVVGKFHSDEKLGTAQQLKNRRSSLRIRNISCFSGADFANPDWKKYEHLADYIFLTDPNLKKTY